MTTLATLVVKLVGDTTGLSKSLNETNGIVENSTGRLGALGGVLKGGLVAGAGAALVGVGALAAGLYSAVGEAMAAEEVMSDLNAVLTSTKGVSGMTAESVTEISDSLSQVTRFEDDVITAGQSMLLTFTNIGKDVFPMATEAMLNMSTKMGTDLQSSAVQLGKALNNPVEGISALTRVGIQFTDAQKEQIATLTEAGDIMGAQKIILAELETQFGGAAVAAGQTFAGQLDIMKNSLGNVKEEVGMALLPALTTLAQTLGPMLLTAAKGLASFLITSVVPALQTLFQWVATNLPPALQTLAQFWTGTLQPALATVWAFIEGSVIPALQVIFTWLATNIPPALQTLANFWSTVLLPALQTVWTFIQGSVIPILLEVFTWLATNIPPALQTLANFWNTVLLPAIRDVWSFIETNLVPLLRSLASLYLAGVKLALAGLALIWEQVLKPALRALWKYIAEDVVPALQRFWEIIDGPVLTALGIFRGAVDAVAGAIRGITDAIQTVIGWFEDMKNRLSNFQLPSWIGSLQGALGGLRLPDFLTPGSPTPLEIALLGIADAFGEASRAAAGFGREMPNGSLALAGAGVDGSMVRAQTPAGGQAGGQWNVTIHVNGGATNAETGRAVEMGVLRAARSMGLR